MRHVTNKTIQKRLYLIFIKQFLVQRQVHQNVIQNPLAAQNQVRIQQPGQQQAAGYRYIETSNGIFLGQLPPNQSLPNDPLRFKTFFEI